ncbi:hypothetical protein [uncultured Bacteroides sp.]|uniref:hypothetical protein n=1 Tax=uncultured Bacteroides sp. TaxID=162156 RepID=UPI0025FD0DFB|nr:hypothetical protein [uncultured Bacteroides sp.]
MESIQSLLGTLLMIIIIIIIGSIAPWLLLILIPYLIYLALGRKKRLKEVDKLLENEFKGKTPQEIESIRITLINTLNNPYATQVERDNAKYAIKYIEEHFYNKR